jgi:hypothetical protein
MTEQPKLGIRVERVTGEAVFEGLMQFDSSSPRDEEQDFIWTLTGARSKPQ